MNACAKHLGVGIDTARYGHHVSFLDDDKRTAAKPFHFSENAEGYHKLESGLQRLVRKHPQTQLHVHVDAAGQYAENLLQWLHRQPGNLIVSVGQPARNEAYRKAHYDKRKADPVESLACARFAVVEKPEPTPPNAPEFSVLRDIVAQIEASATARTRLVNQLHNLLARVFPELTTIIKDLTAVGVLKLLKKYPTAQRIAAARLTTLQAMPYLKAELASRIHQAAAHSTASSRGEFTERLIEQKVEAILQEIQNHQKLNALSQSAIGELPAGPHRRVSTVIGIGPQTTAALLAKIVSIDRFGSAKALIGYFGIFPEEIKVSGTDKDGNPKTQRKIMMSRKGNDLVRRLLYTAAQAAVTHNPPVRALFARLRAAGKDYNTAIGHCMAKLLRQVYAVWKKDCDFDKHYETPAATPSGEASKMAEGHNKVVKPHEQVVTSANVSVAGSTGSGRASRRPLDFGRLRAAISIEVVLELLQWHGVGRGVERRGWCPVHGHRGEREDRSLAVELSRGMYCCHRCGSQGNALDLWVAASGESLLEASWQLIERLGITPPLLAAKAELSATK